MAGLIGREYTYQPPDERETESRVCAHVSGVHCSSSDVVNHDDKFQRVHDLHVPLARCFASGM